MKKKLALLTLAALSTITLSACSFNPFDLIGSLINLDSSATYSRDSEGDPDYSVDVIDHSSIDLGKDEYTPKKEKIDYREVLDDNRWNLKQVLRRFAAVALQTEGSYRFLTGREVMSLLDMKPGRRVGELLDGLDMAVGTGKVNTLAKAEAWLRAQPVKQ